MSRDAATAFARTLVDEWVRAGVTDACLSPGSRSAPLALALAGDGRVRVHVHVDERSAAFFALGLAKASGIPAVVLCTSGTAAANFHPAVLEAHHARVPLLVCTADRPPELRDTGAPQTVDQTRLYGAALRWYAEAATPDDRVGVGVEWRALAARAVAEAVGPRAGPVQLNLPFREPLVPTGAPLVAAPGREGGRPWTVVRTARTPPDSELVDTFVAAVRREPRGLLVAGWGAAVRPETAVRFSTAAGWPVLADSLSGLRVGRHAISTYDALLRVERFAIGHRPDLVVRLGAPLISKAVPGWLDPSVPQIVVDPDRAWLDPQHAAEHLLAVDPDALLSTAATCLPRPATRSAWLGEWLTAETRARRALDELLDGWEAPFEGRIARDLADALPDGATLVVASSMAVRDVESFTHPRAALRFLGNHGVNGIDGFVSTALGVAAATGSRPTVALLGDLCFLHDANGLLGAARRGIDVTFVVLDNDGGGIFSFLPQAGWPEYFETLFGTPHGVDLDTLAAVHGVPATRVEKAAEMVPAVEAAMAAGGVQLVLVSTDRADNVTRHREVWAAVADAIS